MLDEQTDLVQDATVAKLLETEKEARRETIREAMRAASGVAVDAARSLGITRNTLTKWVRDLGLEKEIWDKYPLSVRGKAVRRRDGR